MRRSLWDGCCGSLCASFAVGQSLWVAVRRSLRVGRCGMVAVGCCKTVGMGRLVWDGRCGLVAVSVALCRALWVGRCVG